MIPKPRLRYFIYFFVMVAYFMGSQKSICTIQPLCSWFTPLIVIFCILLILELFFLMRASYRLKGYLDKGDPEKFLKETQKEMKSCPPGAWQSFYKVNLTAGLYYLGRFDEALDVLAEVKPEKLQKPFQSLYYNNKLANLLGAKRIDEAIALVQNNKSFFRPNPQNNKFFFALQANLGVLKYHQEKYEVAEYLLTESMHAHDFPLQTAVGHYYLGCIAQKKGRDTEAQRHFTQARELGANTFLMTWLNESL